MIEIIDVPPKMKSVFSGNNSALTFVYNRNNIEADISTQQGSITIINF